MDEADIRQIERIVGPQRTGHVRGYVAMLDRFRRFIPTAAMQDMILIVLIDLRRVMYPLPTVFREMRFILSAVSRQAPAIADGRQMAECLPCRAIPISGVGCCQTRQGHERQLPNE